MQTANRILLVEDDADDQLLFIEALHLIHPHLICEIAENGVEAMALVGKPPPFDIIFMDLNMPKMNGFECLSLLKSNHRFKHIPVVITTTSNERAHMETCKTLGASKYFVKPNSFSELFNQLRDILSANTSN